MRVAPVSGDMLVKLALGAAAVGAIGWLLYTQRGLLRKLNPADPENVAYQTANQVGSSIVTSPTGPGKNADGSWSLGGFLFDVLNPGTADAVREMSGPVQTQELTGYTYDQQTYYGA